MENNELDIRKLNHKANLIKLTNQQLGLTYENELKYIPDNTKDSDIDEYMEKQIKLESEFNKLNSALLNLKNAKVDHGNLEEKFNKIATKEKEKKEKQEEIKINKTKHVIVKIAKDEYKKYIRKDKTDEKDEKDKKERMIFNNLLAFFDDNEVLKEALSSVSDDQRKKFLEFYEDNYDTIYIHQKLYDNNFDDTQLANDEKYQNAKNKYDEAKNKYDEENNVLQLRLKAVNPYTPHQWDRRIHKIAAANMTVGLSLTICSFFMFPPLLPFGLGIIAITALPYLLVFTPFILLRNYFKKRSWREKENSETVQKAKSDIQNKIEANETNYRKAKREFDKMKCLAILKFSVENEVKKKKEKKENQNFQKCNSLNNSQEIVL